MRHETFLKAAQEKPRDTTTRQVEEFLASAGRLDAGVLYIAYVIGRRKPERQPEDRYPEEDHEHQPR